MRSRMCAFRHTRGDGGRARSEAARERPGAGSNGNRLEGVPVPQVIHDDASEPWSLLRPPSSAADPRPICAAPLTHFFRGTLAPICETSDAFAAVSVQVFGSENRNLASQLASYNFLKQPSENTKRREVAAHESFNLAGPTGLEPATSGVTGRRAKVFGRSLSGVASRSHSKDAAETEPRVYSSRNASAG